VPGERAQSDFTHMSDLEVTIQRQPFPHLLYHFVLTYSNAEAIQVCFGETFEALTEGIEQALWHLGGVPAQHRTNHLSTAIRHLPTEEQEAFSERYLALSTLKYKFTRTPRKSLPTPLASDLSSDNWVR
jgi:hypothetical protein